MWYRNLKRLQDVRSIPAVTGLCILIIGMSVLGKEPHSLALFKHLFARPTQIDLGLWELGSNVENIALKRLSTELKRSAAQEINIMWEEHCGIYFETEYVYDRSNGTLTCGRYYMDQRAMKPIYVYSRVTDSDLDIVADKNISQANDLVALGCIKKRIK